MFATLRQAATGRAAVASLGGLTTGLAYRQYQAQLNINTSLSQQLLAKDAELTRVAQEGQQLRVQLATAFERQEEQDRLSKVEKGVREIENDTKGILFLTATMSFLGGLLALEPTFFRDLAKGRLR